MPDDTGTKAHDAPRFNHVAMSVPADLLGEEGRREIVRFYHDVFGFEELPTETIDRKRLVLGCGRLDQFIFLIADDPPMTCPRLDHYGFSVQSEEHFDDLLARAKAFREHDDRVEIIDRKTDDHSMLSITSFYVRYLLPMMVEIQWWDFKQDRGTSYERATAGTPGVGA
ncbi:MAG TPA: VOC family protein [Acidimicrobiia bacterium]|nr:VOC family protein [Acidimicrobiia bacterium]